MALIFTGDGSGATVVPDTATTDPDGQATFQVVLGSRVGPATAEARVAVAGGQRILAAPLQFDAVSADANQLAAVAGDGQSAPAGATLPDPLVVQVTDEFGNPIAGVPIAWSADGGSVSAETTATGSDGLASVERTLGADAGVQHASASAPGLAGSPVTFSHTASAGAASVLERVSGDGQSALAGTSVADPLVVRAKDAAGNPVAGLAVAWVVGTGGGTLAPQTSTTGGDGLASTRWTLGANPGANSATAVISGVGTAGFSATANPGTPPALSFVDPAARCRRTRRRSEPVSGDPAARSRRRRPPAGRGGRRRHARLGRWDSPRDPHPDDRRRWPSRVPRSRAPGAARLLALAFTAAGYAGVSSGPIRCRAPARARPSCPTIPILP